MPSRRPTCRHPRTPGPMRRRGVQTLAVLACLAATGCVEYPTSQPATASLAFVPGETGRGMSLASVANVAVSGRVLAPAVVAAGGGNVIAAGGGNVVPGGGANVVAAGGGNFTGTRRLLALSNEAPVAGALVHLADLTGNPLPGLAPAVTDAEGHFSFAQVPRDTAYMVVARFETAGGASASLSSLGHSSCDGSNQVVSVATTLVTTAFVQSGAPAVWFDPSAFETAARAVEADLTEATMPDITQPAAVAAMAQAIAETPAVRKAIERSQQAPPAAAAAPANGQAGLKAGPAKDGGPGASGHGSSGQGGSGGGGSSGPSGGNGQGGNGQGQGQGADKAMAAGPDASRPSDADQGKQTKKSDQAGQGPKQGPAEDCPPENKPESPKGQGSDAGGGSGQGSNGQGNSGQGGGADSSGQSNGKGPSGDAKAD